MRRRRYRQHWRVKLAAKGIAPSGGLSIFENDPLILGKKVYESNCRVCHKVQGEGGDTDLTFTGLWFTGMGGRIIKKIRKTPDISKKQR